LHATSATFNERRRGIVFVNGLGSAFSSQERRVKPLILFCAALVSGVLTFVTNWFALKPWRRAAGRHWTERARILYPVRVAAISNQWVLPVTVSLGAELVWPETAPRWWLIAIASVMGAIAGTIPLEREVFPRLRLPEIAWQCVLAWIVRFFLGGIFFGACVLMPDMFDPQAFLIAGAFLLLLFFWSHNGWVGLCQCLGLFTKPTERLERIVRETAEKMNVAYGQILMMRSKFAQAYAMPATRRLLVSERLVKLLPDDEIGAICAHELAHLTEKRSEHWRRYLIWLTFLPWIFVHPVIHRFNAPGFFTLIAITFFAPKLTRFLSVKLEARADSIAHANESGTGVYARALARIYEDNLLPAVNVQKTATHPDLYDRLEASGVTPDFPRPARPEKIAWHGMLFSIVMGIVIAMSALKYLHTR
jgi:Zn-dependent protease with chaperone function